MGKLNLEAQSELDSIRNENNKYRRLDPTTLMAIFCGRALTSFNTDPNCGVNIGSSRGATSVLEAEIDYFNKTGKSHPSSSPSTTLGNISSWVAQDLKTIGINLSHSITCSTALHSITNAAAWLKSGFSSSFIAGGSEAPLTPFTIAQMDAMRIYSHETTEKFPCKSFDFTKDKNTMVLGEGAGLFLLDNNPLGAIVAIESIGYSTESITHGSSLSEDGECIKKAMEMALEGISISEVDAIVMHAPGTLVGDQAEKQAIDSIFGDHIPLLTSNKWKIGHTLGASGALSIEFAILMLQNQYFIGFPWDDTFHFPSKLSKILINAVGFGGNAVSVLVSLPKNQQESE